MFPLFLCFAGYALAQMNPRKLGCERMYGEYGNMDTVFLNALQPGDRFIVDGVVSTSPGIISINLVIINVTNDIAIHFRNDINTRPTTIYDAFINGRWTGQEFAPQPFRAGQPYNLAFVYTGLIFDVFFNQIRIYSFRLRTPSWYPIGVAHVSGSHRTNYIELQCKNPPTSAPPMRGDHGHGHGHGHGKDSSSDSSEECED
ncbi:unnamed protein product [Caenorhabditis sp. 36 PRJEB53466]|nr:unnamed protein product [Caenorhabditis sp. 36 PRJEB53466]